jgi:nicotinamidase-related amidase
MASCLIVVDYQNDFVDGALGFPGAEALDGRIAAKIRKYRANGDEVVFTFDTHGEDYYKTQEGRNLPVAHCVRGTAGHGLYGETGGSILADDKRFYKPAFGSDELYEYLKRTPFERIELAGLVSNICVIANAVLAKTAQPETPILVDRDCTASHDPELHEATLAVMRGLQIRVIKNVDDPGPFYHGTKAALAPGALLKPGCDSNYGEGAKANFIYFSASLSAAVWGAELAAGDGRERVYIVEPTGEIEDDPNLTDKKFPGNVTRSYRSREPLRVVGEAQGWEAHTPEEIANMRQGIEEIKAKGIEAIND